MIHVALTREMADVAVDALEDWAEQIHRQLTRMVAHHEHGEAFHYIASAEGNARTAARLIRGAANPITEAEARVLDGNR